jgi:hypothetical protein
VYFGPLLCKLGGLYATCSQIDDVRKNKFCGEPTKGCPTMVYGELSDSESQEKFSGPLPAPEQFFFSKIIDLYKKSELNSHTHLYVHNWPIGRSVRWRVIEVSV